MIKIDIKNKVKSFNLFFINIIKWLVLSIVTGLTVGAVATVFIDLLKLVTDYVGGFDYYYLLLPIALFLSGIIVKHFAPTADGHGTEKVIEAIHSGNGKINFKVVPVKIVATVLTISFGGSAGKEGPTTQIGAGIASTIASIFRLSDKDRKKLVICGMAAAFSAIFSTPIAAAIFAVEVLVVGRLNLKNIFPIMTTSIVSHIIFQYLGGGTEMMPHIDIDINLANSFLLIQSLGSGIAFGLVAVIVIFLLNISHKVSENIKIYKPFKGLIGGILLVILTLSFGTNYLGMGIDYFLGILNGNQANYYDFLIKIIFTVITLSFCGSGGILTPLMFIGITAGNVFAHFLGLNPVMFSCLGFLAVLSGATNTPLACTIMAFEMFKNPSFALMAAIACAVSYLVTGHRSVYPTQMMKESKISYIWLDSMTAGHPNEHFDK